MRLHLFQLLLPLLLLVTACREPIRPSDPVFDDKIALQKRIRIALDKGYIRDLGFSKEVSEKITTFYKQRGFKPVWANDSTLLSKSERVLAIVDQPNAMGLPGTRWNSKIADRKELITKELLLTARLGSAVQDLQTGLLDTATKSLKKLSWPEASVMKQLIPQTDTVSDWGKWIAGLGPHHKDYRLLAKGLFEYSFNRSFSEKEFKIPSIKEDSAACYEMAKLSLIDKGYLIKTDTGDSVFTAALSSFQTENGLKPDGVIGTYTKKALEESAQAKIDRAILSLERWRWREKFTSRYIWINIPEYTLRVYYNDTLFSRHNVVVGKYDTKTPQLKSRIRNIISYPYWTVPFSITSKEFLPALKANSNYLAKNNLKIFRKKDEEIDPSTVNWKKIPAKTFPYKVRQEPGTFNSLGIIKFEFSNPYGVYVHDTPSKSLFRNDIRSYSHGCIRCQMPDSLARFILRRDKQKLMPVDSLDSMLLRAEHRTISLKHPVDIQVDYITVTADERNRLTFYPDIYDRDADFLKWFARK